MHPFLDWPGPLAFAHRGDSSEYPENTLAAFRSAVESGFTYLETDVHATSDGVLVAFHDDDLRRVAGRPERIDALPWSEVASALVNGTEPIPRFEELLQEFPHARFNVDCKDESGVRPLVELLQTRPELLDRVLVGGFDDRRTQRIRAAVGPRLATSLGVRGIASFKFAGRLPWPGQAFQVPARRGRMRVVTPGLVRRAHGAGLQVHVWTIDHPAEMHALFDLGVDGIMTDRPAVLKEVMADRGIWYDGG